MFRIKTDIRQYKCETKEKVEKLIRNWVIRPSDLIYDQDENTWEPIGEHPAFEGVFDILAETEANTPDTVVSREPEDPNKSNDREVTSVEGKPEEEDSRATDIFDQDEIANSLAEKDSKKTNGLAPPEAPDGVEPARHDEEVTMMTDKTFDMIAAEHSSEVADDEDTGVKEKPKNPDGDEATDDSEEAASLAAESDPTIVETNEDETKIDAPKLGRHDLPEDFFATNEIDPVSREDVEMRDDLGEAGQKTETSEVDEEWENMVDDFRTTNELDPQEIKEAIEAKEKAQDDAEGDPEPEDSDAAEDDPALRDTGELERPDDETPEDEEMPHDEFDEEEEEPGLYEPSEPVYIDGYKIPAPFDVGPTMEDQRAGLRRTKVPESRRLSTFPEPRQKEYKVPEIRHYDRTPPTPKDYTLLLVIGSWVVLAIIIFFVGMC